MNWLKITAVAVLGTPIAAGAESASGDSLPVPGRLNVRIVDYGNDMGSGRYRGHVSELFSDPRGEARVDSDGDGETVDDSVSGWRFSMTEPLNPQGGYYNDEAPNSIFYGGVIGHHSNNPSAQMSEGGLNENHELRDDCNMMSVQNVASRKRGNFVQAWGLWFWKKEDFLNNGDECTVTFDNDSMIAVHISRYWDDVDGGRWVVRDGEQFYVSEETFGAPEDIERRGRGQGIRLLHAEDRGALFALDARSKMGRSAWLPVRPRRRHGRNGPAIE